MYKQAFVAPRKGQPGYNESRINFNLGELLPALGQIAGTFSTAYKNKTGKNNMFTRVGDMLGTAGNAAYTIQHPVTVAGSRIGSAVGRAVNNNSPYSGIIGGIIGGLPGLFGQMYKQTQDYKNNPYNYIMY